MDGQKIPDNLKQRFDELATLQTTLQMKVDAFSRSLQMEAHAIAVAYKRAWDETKSTLHLEGDWRYQDGMVYPMSLVDIVQSG